MRTRSNSSGYGAENGTWRNFYLSGTTELREGNFGTPTVTAAPAIVAQLTPVQLLDSLAISVNGPRAWDLDLSLDVTFTDLHANYRIALHNGVLIYIERPADDTADMTLTLTKGRMLGLLAGDISSPGIDIAGDEKVLRSLLDVLEKGNPSFNIVTP